MRAIIYTFIYLVLISSFRISESTDFGYMSYSSFNIGDDIQSIAARRFLPKNSIPIDREFIGVFHHPSPVYTILNGWYMHTKDFFWYRPDVFAPEKSWPPSPSIKPLLIAIHFTQGFLPFALSDEGVNYLKKYGPVGARDYYTLQELQKRNIPSYFSGCLTLTLKNDCKERNDVIYAVDLDEECLNFIKSRTYYQVEELTHVRSDLVGFTPKERLKYAESILEKYKRAKCVITSRLHASMPCLALQTPVLLINVQPDQYRFDGLRELAHNCSREEFLMGAVDFNFNDPPKNPDAYLPIRKNLIKIVKQWVRKHAKSKS